VNNPREYRRQGATLAAALETATLCGLGLLAIFWIIPWQTSGNALGLDPAFMPTVYAGAFVVLVLTNGVLYLSGRITASPLTNGAVGPVIVVMAICCAGITAFEFVGAAACGLLVVPGIMIVLGERRWVLIAATTMVTAAGLALVFR
jgi:hypothetical protein